MKCKSCTCPVSSEFNYAFSINCCPKCGDTIMDVEVQKLYLKMQRVLKIDDNDVGDLAVWFINDYLKKMIPTAESDDIEADMDSSEDLPEEIHKKQPRKTKVARANSTTDVSIFAKNAGFGGNKLDKLVRDIQGIKNDNQDIDLNIELPQEEMDQSVDLYSNVSPLSNREMGSLEDLFTPSTAGDSDSNFETELRKLQRESSGATGSKVKRS